MLSCSQRAAALPTGVEERASAPLDSGRRRRSSVVVVEPVRSLVSGLRYARRLATPAMHTATSSAALRVRGVRLRWQILRRWATLWASA